MVRGILPSRYTLLFSKYAINSSVSWFSKDLRMFLSIFSIVSNISPSTGLWVFMVYLCEERVLIAPSAKIRREYEQRIFSFEVGFECHCQIIRLLFVQSADVYW